MENKLKTKVNLLIMHTMYFAELINNNSHKPNVKLLSD